MKMKKTYLLAAAVILLVLGAGGLAEVLFAAEGDGPSMGIYNVRENYSYRNITTATTTYVKSAPGTLAGILVNGGTMGAITVKDNTATVTGSTVATIASPTAGQVIPFGIRCSNGIGIVTADNTNLTVIYK